MSDDDRVLQTISGPASVEDASSWGSLQSSTERASRDTILDAAARQKVQQRGQYGQLLVIVAVLWLVVVGLAIFADGHKDSDFNLEPEVAVALLVSATANVFAPVLVIVKGVFGDIAS